MTRGCWTGRVDLYDIDDGDPMLIGSFATREEAVAAARYVTEMDETVNYQIQDDGNNMEQLTISRDRDGVRVSR